VSLRILRGSNGSDTGDLIAELDAMMALINPERVKAEARRGEESQ